MKLKNVLIVLFIFNVFTLLAQDSMLSYGITAGYNYNSNGELVTTGTLTELTEQFDSDQKSGYHAGIFVQFKGKKIYLRPELVYAKSESRYNSRDFNQTSIKMPVSLGINILKPLSIFAGPSFQYNLDTKLQNIEVKNIDLDKDISVSFQAGVALEFFKFIRASIRYEKGISDNILTIKDNADAVIGKLDTKHEQLLLTVSIKM